MFTNRSFAKRLAIPFVAVALTGCGDDSTGPIACTEEFRYGITIEVRDGATGEGAAVGAEGTLTEGAYVEELMIFGDDTMLGAGERAGTYDVLITKTGFEDWTASRVTVTADECHVHPVGLQANLVREPN
jgi:hypothetical protein